MGRRKKEIEPVKQLQTYLVVYMVDGTIHLNPCEDKEEAEAEFKYIMKTKWKKEVKTHRIIKRDLSKCKDGLIL